MYEQQKMFINFVANRSLYGIDVWLKTLECPVINVDGTRNYKNTAFEIAEWYQLNYETKIF